MQDTIHCNKEILKNTTHSTTQKKGVKFSVKAKLQETISHTIMGNIKATFGISYI